MWSATVVHNIPKPDLTDSASRRRRARLHARARPRIRHLHAGLRRSRARVSRAILRDRSRSPDGRTPSRKDLRKPTSVRPPLAPKPTYRDLCAQIAAHLPRPLVNHRLRAMDRAATCRVFFVATPFALETRVARRPGAPGVGRRADDICDCDYYQYGWLQARVHDRAPVRLPRLLRARQTRQPEFVRLRAVVDLGTWTALQRTRLCVRRPHHRASFSPADLGAAALGFPRGVLRWCARSPLPVRSTTSLYPQGQEGHAFGSRDLPGQTPASPSGSCTAALVGGARRIPTRWAFAFQPGPPPRGHHMDRDWRGLFHTLRHVPRDLKGGGFVRLSSDTTSGCCIRTR